MVCLLVNEMKLEWYVDFIQPAFTCYKLTIKTPEQCVKSVLLLTIDTPQRCH